MKHYMYVLLGMWFGLMCLVRVVGAATEHKTATLSGWLDVMISEGPGQDAMSDITIRS
jgi:hypothetical protein